MKPMLLLIVATDWADELQVTDDVRSWAELSENVPVAVNCCGIPTATLELDGRTRIEARVAGVTVRTVDGEMPPCVAVIVVGPTAVEVACPLEPAALLIVATDGVDEFQVTDDVRSCVVLSENVPVAVNCWEVPNAMTGVVGAILMETNALEVVFPPPPLPQPAAIASNRIGMEYLFDFIDAYTTGDQIRRIGPPPQIPHVPPRLDDDIIRYKPPASAPLRARSLPQGGRVLPGIGSEELREVGMDNAVPGDTENDPGRRNVLPNSRRFRRHLLHRVPSAGS